MHTNGRPSNVLPAGASGGIADRRCWSNGYRASLTVRGCWTWAVEEGRTRTISIGAGIALWAWIERVRCSQRDDVDIVHCRWSALIFAISHFKRCRSMAYGLPPRWCIFRNRSHVVSWPICAGSSVQAAYLPWQWLMAWRAALSLMDGSLGAISLAGERTNSLVQFAEPDGQSLN